MLEYTKRLSFSCLLDSISLNFIKTKKEKLNFFLTMFGSRKISEKKNIKENNFLIFSFIKRKLNIIKINLNFIYI